MSKSAVITVKTDPIIKKAAQELSRNMGLTLSDAVNVLLRNFVREKRLVGIPYHPVDDEGEYKESFVKEMLEYDSEVVAIAKTPEDIDKLFKR